jgi:two-component system sensor kinase FixL
MRDDTGFVPPGDAARILAAIVESSDDAIIGKDLAGVIVSWNGGAQRMYGYSAHEVIGRPVSLLIPDGYPDELVHILQRILAGQRVDHYETRRLTKDGRILDVSLTVSPIRDVSGQIVGASAIARDITARKREDLALRTSEARWRAVVESAVDGIVVIDGKGTIESFNPEAERLFGYAERDVIGRNVSMLMPVPDRDDHDQYLARYLATGVKKIIGMGREVTGRRRDGSTFPVHLAVGEMSVGGERRFTGIVHDLTARVQLEERVREQSSLARIGEMAAVLAHEVKNPLAAVRGAIQVIGGRLPPGNKDAPIIKEVLSRLDALNELMQDLLRFARPPQPRCAPVVIVPLLTMTADLLRQDPSLKDFRVDVTGTAPPVMADAELLKIVFLNLMLNAAHAMEARGMIHAAVTPVGGFCHIAITDSGPGIPPETRHKLFTPFFTTKARGTGLGLSIAKRLVEAHLGSISLDCPPGGGTTVTVRLPATTEKGHLVPVD